MMKTIVIDGLGLIGGSIALAIRQQWPQYKIIGVDINHHSLTYAKEREIIDDGFAQLQNCAGKADIILLAAPVSVILKHMDQLTQMQLKPGVIITDVGSTKKQIMAKASLFIDQGIHFIGGHPMAGSHKTTITASRANLFQSAYYFLISDTLNDRPSKKAVDELQALLFGLNVKWQLVSARQHDQIVAQISHLPHILASGLVNMAQDEFRGSTLSLKLAAGGFRSLTRIASSDPDMWTDILLSNRQTLIDKIDTFNELLQHVKAAILSSDRTAIRNYFRRAKITRDSINAQASSHSPNFYDLFVNIPDRVGSVAEVTRILTEAEINLINIHILEIREEINGVLQLSFSNQNDLADAACALKQHGLSVIRGE
ncbi:prephenate dehydrogenase [Sporolactobacillus shoreicorticis]|uniref:Prephenate dehydrogenase n=1 Tax=Sporolactobacillus shoreicorticis TaxID=1923877 RepID=A0ABW5S4G4_9BACL|nr:prephenate dehydrogenase [Sporolactobacillus shoreicorticis]MCO7125859.1 prephenate dehydrogenase [Sporolactobacillus shoreicorticis]